MDAASSKEETNKPAIKPDVNTSSTEKPQQLEKLEKEEHSNDIIKKQSVSKESEKQGSEKNLK